MVVQLQTGGFSYSQRNPHYRLTLRTPSWIITSASLRTISRPNWRSTSETWAAPAVAAEGDGVAEGVVAGPAVEAGLTR